MYKRNLTAAQAAFGSGKTTDQLYKTEVKLTDFEVLLNKLGLTEQDCLGSEEVQAWIKANKDRRYCPERLIRALKVGTVYDSEPSAYSLVNGVVLTEPEPLQEVETADETPQNN